VANRATRILRLALVALALAGSSSQIRADTLILDGTLSILLSDLPAATLDASAPLPVLVSSGAGSFTEPASVFGPATISVDLPPTDVPLISGYTIVGLANGTQVFDGSAGTATGALAGTALVNIQQLFDLVIPLSPVGRPGATARTTVGALHVTVVGQGWTTGVASVTGITRTTPGGQVVHTATLSGADDRTPAHAGSLVLVSGFRVITNAGATLPGFAVQTLHFMTPEPGLPAQLGAALLVLAWIGQRRRRPKRMVRRTLP
jgi:MYXO-CTERM domain-containing protein